MEAGLIRLRGMNPAARQLSFLSHELKAWAPVICRSTYLTSVTFSVEEAGLAVRGVTGDRVFELIVPNVELLGHTAQLPKASWTVPKRTCYWSRQIIQRLLSLRGV